MLKVEEEFRRKMKKFGESKTEDQMAGKSANRKLNEKWNIKLQLKADLFEDIFRFLRSMQYKTIFRFREKNVKLFVMDESTSHMAYVVIDRTEISDYISGVVNGVIDEKEIKEKEIKDGSIDVDSGNDNDEIVVYCETDVIEEMSINGKYPVDVYFDTLDKQRMYIVNAKNKKSRRLMSTDNQDSSSSSYKSYEDKIQSWIKDQNTFKMSVGYKGFKDVMASLDKIKGDKKEVQVVEIKFGINEIEFNVGSGDDVKSSSDIMYGEDIAVRGKREVTNLYNLEYLVKFGRLDFDNTVNFYINEEYPLIMGSNFGHGKFEIYYVVANRADAEEYKD